MQIQPSESLLNTISIGYDKVADTPPKSKPIDFLEESSVITTISTGFERHDDKPVIKDVIDIKSIKSSKNKESILNNVDTGFSECNIINIDCKKKIPKYKMCLYKENYLSEFKSQTEKALARFNLGVYSKEEVENKIKLIIESSNLVNTSNLEIRLKQLDFVDSTAKSYTKYNIPEKLFN